MLNSRSSGVSVSAAARDLLIQTHTRLSQRRGEPVPHHEFYPVRLDVLVEEVLGWRIERVSSVGHHGDEMTLDPIHGTSDFADRLITIAVDTQRPARQNFTLAHEIGHIVLHSDLDLVRARRVHSVRSVKGVPQDKALWRLEREANLFATELLMPPKAVRVQFESTFGCSSLDVQAAIRKTQAPSSDWRDTELLVKASEAVAAHREFGTESSMHEFFGVSRTSMGVRLRELGLVTV
jgi:hypothetical protein